MRGADDCTNTITTVQKDNLVVESQCLRMVRTEEGKRLRKQYESHEVRHGFSEHTEPDIRPDNCTNTITTVQKDNMILESRKVGTTHWPHGWLGLNADFSDVSPTIDAGISMQHTLIIEQDEVQVKQATKDGAVSCKIGGGGRSVISNKQNTKGKGDREWRSLPNADDGEYP